MKNFIGLFIAILVALLGTVGIAHAITNGEPDNDGHPYVAFITDGQFGCSGAAISEQVIVSAAHCFDESVTNVIVTFDPDVTGNSAEFHTGAWHPDPDFCHIDDCPAQPDVYTHDLAVVVLDNPVSLSRYAQLPTEGLVDTLPMKKVVTIVGYGVHEFAQGLPDQEITRFFALTNLVPGNDVKSDDFIKLAASGKKKGGVCFGDSGGPDLLGDTDTILAVNSFGGDVVCQSVAWSYRIDTETARSFLSGFGVDLP